MSGGSVGCDALVDGGMNFRGSNLESSQHSAISTQPLIILVYLKCTAADAL